MIEMLKNGMEDTFGECRDSFMDCMQIRYIRLHFELEITEAGSLPRDKASMLRGGMGQMLLMMNCVRDGKCEKCDFSQECLVQRMMYAKMKIRPDFMTQKDSEGYVLECENKEEYFSAGDILDFNFLLFGDSIVYFNQYLQAFHALGIQGIGKEHLQFRILRVTNSRRDLLLEGSAFYKDKFTIGSVGDYVRYRLRELDCEKNIVVDFRSALTLKYRGNYQSSFEPLPILAAAERRLYILNCYEGKKEGEDFRRIAVEDHLPEKLDEKVHLERVKRYSSTQNAKVVFTGIKGFCRLSGADRTALALLAAGELIHIGKNTSFGFGRYRISVK